MVRLLGAAFPLPSLLRYLDLHSTIFPSPCLSPRLVPLSTALERTRFHPPSLPFIQILETKRTLKTDTCALTLHCSRPALISFQDITLLAQRAVEQCRVPWMQGAIAHATGEAEWWVTISTPGKVGVARGIGFEGVGR